MRQNLRLNMYLLRIMMLDRTENRLRLFFDIFTMCLRVSLLIGIYYYLFELKGQVINGLTLQLVAWSFLFYFSFLMINFRYIQRTIMQEVKSGKIEILLSKPVNYLSYKFFENLGNKLVPFVLNFIVMFTLLAIVMGIPENITNIFFISTFIVTFIFCLILNFFIYSIIGVLAFWLEDNSSIGWIIDKFVMILGGAFLPIAFFPSYLKALAIYSPFGASMFITHTVYPTWPAEYFGLMSVQIFWIIVLFIVLHLVFKKASKNLSVNGG